MVSLGLHQDYAKYQCVFFLLSWTTASRGHIQQSDVLLYSMITLYGLCENRPLVIFPLTTTTFNLHSRHLESTS